MTDVDKRSDQEAQGGDPRSDRYCSRTGSGSQPGGSQQVRQRSGRH